MKKLIAGLMTLLMMTLSLVIPVFAPTSPCPIALDIMTLTPDMAYGKTIILKDGGVSFFQMKVNVLSEATGYYEWSTDIGHLKPLCGSYEAVILECEEQSTCHKTVSMNMAGYTTWNIDGVDLDVVCPSVPVCDTCDVCDICDQCVIPTTTTTLPTDEPNGEWISIEQLLLGELVGLVVILTFLFKTPQGKTIFLKAIGSMVKDGWGFKLYRYRGILRLKHKNPGVVAYHEPDINHIKDSAKHKKGVILG